MALLFSLFLYFLTWCKLYFLYCLAWFNFMLLSQNLDTTWCYLKIIHSLTLCWGDGGRWGLSKVGNDRKSLGNTLFEGIVIITVSCHCHNSDMTLLWRYLQIKCYQSLWTTGLRGCSKWAMSPLWIFFFFCWFGFGHRKGNFTAKFAIGKRDLLEGRQCWNTLFLLLSSL